MERGFEIKVLDHGYVRLVDYMGSDEAIVEAARMSTGRGFVSWDRYQRCKHCDWINNFRDAVFMKCGDSFEHDWQIFPRGDLGLLETMYKNKHSTPFEFGTLHIEVQAPLMVYREWHRHRTWGYSEFSARYSQMPDMHYLPAPERVQRQSTTNRQGSSDETLAKDLVDSWRQCWRQEQEDVYRHYDNAVGLAGIAKEVARINTPVSRYSKMRGIVNLRNVLAFLLLRKAPAAQWEIRQYADAVGEMVKAIWPRTYGLFEEHDLHGVHLSRAEADEVRELIRAWERTGTDDDLSVLNKKLGMS